MELLSLLQHKREVEEIAHVSCSFQLAEEKWAVYRSNENGVETKDEVDHVFYKKVTYNGVRTDANGANIANVQDNARVIRNQTARRRSELLISTSPRKLVPAVINESRAVFNLDETCLLQWVQKKWRNYARTNKTNHPKSNFLLPAAKTSMEDLKWVQEELKRLQQSLRERAENAQEQIAHEYTDRPFTLGWMQQELREHQSVVKRAITARLAKQSIFAEVKNTQNFKSRYVKLSETLIPVCRCDMECAVDCRYRELTGAWRSAYWRMMRRITGVEKGTRAARINGDYVRVAYTHNDRPLFQKLGEPNIWMRYCEEDGSWVVHESNDDEPGFCFVRSSRFEINRGDPTEVQTWEDITNNISEAQSSSTKNMIVQFRQTQTPPPLEENDNNESKR